MNKTKQTVVITLLFLLTATAMAWPFGGKSGDENATGKISKLTVSGSAASVGGYTENGSLWLGYTVTWNDGHEKDYPPVKVEGSFTKSLAFQLRPQGVRKVVVALWKYKVSKKECEKANGSACKHCRKNGFHMEGRVHTKTGS